MPELPEVENLKRGLEKAIVGQKVLRIEVHKPKLVSGKGTIRKADARKTREFALGLKGARITAVERRAKNLIFRLSENKIILTHLKMSGQFAYRPTLSRGTLDSVIGGHPIELSEKELPNKHTHIIFELEKGTLYYNDTRMFGYVLYYPTLAAFEKENHFALLGLEPFDKKFTAEYLYEALKNKKGKIKAVLMDQKIVTGLGNIYADESLFEAGIRPERQTNLISKKEAAILHTAIIRIMKQAIKVGGSSVATYRLLDMSQGNYAREHKVYGKSGEKCFRCKTPLRKIIIQSRTTIFCPKCQH
ncbi:MAG: bifunctional DNA-formamidopyrimidine glycosylase/DNA-(apurinic or apyrimidinic site) lyase [Candidatus Paceibacterota bacterium]|jgi:formamidopyrimidine-DNA glycosylase